MDRAARMFEGTHDFAAVRSVGTNVRSTVPVSYTHLDVYKRQVPAHSDAEIRGAITPVVNATVDRINKNVAKRNSYLKAWGDKEGPVSYTHLDVYKRQRRSWGRRSCLPISRWRPRAADRRGIPGSGWSRYGRWIKSACGSAWAVWTAG